MSEQRFIETWKESAEYDQAAELFDQVNAIDDYSVTHVSLKVTTVNPDGTEKTKRVKWSLRTELVED